MVKIGLGNESEEPKTALYKCQRPSQRGRKGRFLASSKFVSSCTKISSCRANGIVMFLEKETRPWPAAVHGRSDFSRRKVAGRKASKSLAISC